LISSAETGALHRASNLCKRGAPNLAVPGWGHLTRRWAQPQAHHLSGLLLHPAMPPLPACATPRTASPGTAGTEGRGRIWTSSGWGFIPDLKGRWGREQREEQGSRCYYKVFRILFKAVSKVFLEGSTWTRELLLAGVLGIAEAASLCLGCTKRRQQGDSCLCLRWGWEEAGLERQLVQERKISGLFNTILLLMLLRSARAGKGQRGPCPWGAHGSSSLDNEKKCFL